MSRWPARLSLVLALSVPASAFAACGARQASLFDIGSAAELSRLMDIQAEAERFVAGSKGEAGGSVTGRLFADAGAVSSVVALAGTQGAAAAGMWDRYSSVMSTSAEASMHLLPGEMKLVVTASPTWFAEDSTATGTWSVEATATSKHWNLTEELLTAVLEKGMQGASLDPVLDKAGRAMKRRTKGAVSQRLVELAEAVAKDKLGGDALVDFSAGQLGDFLAAIGASEGPNGFYIPAQCWQVDDGWDGWAFAEVDGAAIALSGEHGYVPQGAGTATLRIWTVDGKQAFGNRMRSASVAIEVAKIEVELVPSIQQVEPGARVPFIATVHNALDPGLAWTASAGQFVDRHTAGPTSETNVLATPTDPAQFPIRVEARSTSTSGPRGRAGAPVRRGRAVVQLVDPVIDIQPAGGCLLPGDKRRFSADVLGAENQAVDWTATGPAGGAIDDAGEFSAIREGTYVVRATWEDDPEVSSEVQVRVTEDCDSWFTLTASGDVNLHQEGPLHVLGTRHKDGSCVVAIQMGRPMDLLDDPNLSLSAALPDGLQSGRYKIDRRFTGVREDETNGAYLVMPFEPASNAGALRASPGVFFSGAFLSPAHSRITGDRLMGGGTFTGESGALDVERLPGNRIELSFVVQLIETSAEGKQVLEGVHLRTVRYPLRRMTIRGHAVHTLRPPNKRKGLFDVYGCEPLE